MYIHVCVYNKVFLPSFLSRETFIFKAVVILVPFALWRDFSKAEQCQSCKPLPL